MQIAKMIVLDIDGVIIGTIREGNNKNTPHPHPAVIAKLKEVSASGIPIVFCTAKPAFTHRSEIRDCNLNNPHIVDGGAVIMDGAEGILKEHNLDSELAVGIVESLIDDGIYTEAYTTDGYFTQKSQICDITAKREFVLRKPTVVVPSLVEFCRTHKITKLLTDIHSSEAEKYGQKYVAPLHDKVNSVLINASAFADTKVGAITALGVSKKQGVIEVAEILGVSLDDFLAVGDSMSDWGFMRVCGHVATMGNGDEELKREVIGRENRGFVGGDVDEDGVIGVLDWVLRR